LGIWPWTRSLRNLASDAERTGCAGLEAATAANVERGLFEEAADRIRELGVRVRSTHRLDLMIVILGPEELTAWVEAQDSDQSLEGVIRGEMLR